MGIRRALTLTPQTAGESDGLTPQTAGAGKVSEAVYAAAQNEMQEEEHELMDPEAGMPEPRTPYPQTLIEGS